MHIERGSLGKVTPERGTTVVIPLNIIIQRTDDVFWCFGEVEGETRNPTAVCPNAQVDELWKFLQDRIKICIVLSQDTC